MLDLGLIIKEKLTQFVIVYVDDWLVGLKEAPMLELWSHYHSYHFAL